jgi:Protein of unknown function (DUF2442)
MSTSAAETGPRAIRVTTTHVELIVALADGRTIIVPLSWYPRLQNATPEQRQTFRLLDDGESIHWPAIAEDVPISGLLRGGRASQR